MPAANAPPPPGSSHRARGRPVDRRRSASGRGHGREAGDRLGGVGAPGDAGARDLEGGYEGGAGGAMAPSMCEEQEGDERERLTYEY